MLQGYLIETRLGAPYQGSESQIAALLAELGAQQHPKLMLHAHGGLVDANSAKIEAFNMDWTFRRELGPTWSRGYLIWHTDIREQIIRGLTLYGSDHLAKSLHRHVRAWTDDRAGADGRRDGDPDTEAADPEEIARRLQAAGEADAGGEPLEEPIALEIERRLAADPEFVAICAAIDDITRGSPTPNSTDGVAAFAALDLEVRHEIQGQALGPNGRGAASIVAARAGLAALRVILRFLRKRDHGLQATVLEEVVRLFYLDIIGAAVWRNMKTDAADHMAANGAGKMLLDGLEALAAGGKTVELVLVGHSAGAILALHVLRALKDLSKNIKVSLVTWGAAATHKLTAEQLDAGTAARLSGLAVFNLSDAYEKSDPLGDVVPGNPYPRSLLYLISGVLEPDLKIFPHADAPLLGMERHSAIKDSRLNTRERKDRDHVRAAFARFADHVWTCACPKDCDNTYHGNFGRDPKTHQTTARVITSGFTAKPACPGHG